MNTKKTTLIQAIKYGVVGISNTFITFIVITLMMKLLGYSDFISNIVGYVAGVVNSFIWNKKWTFSNSTGWKNSLFRFLIAFGICYVIQYGLVMILNKNLTIDHIYNHYIGMVFYTAINFFANKYYVFKESEKEYSKI